MAEFPASSAEMADGSRHLSRRAALMGLGAGALSLAAGNVAHADILGLVVVGADGWLYPIWDEVRRFDAGRFKQATQTIIDAVALMKKAGIETTLSITPSKSRVYREYLPKDFVWAPEAEKRYALALETMRKQGILVSDLATTFIEARRANPAEQYFFKTDTHWNPMGAELAGAQISKDVLAKLRLPPSAKPGVKLGDYIEMVQAKNDLSEQLPPAEKPKYPKERYRIRGDAGGTLPEASLLEDDTADVVLIGNSYTQPKYGFSRALSQGLNRPVGLTWRVHQYGSYAILLEYLKSAAFKKAKPKLIVWDFTETDMEAPPDRKDFWGDHAMTSEQFLAAVRTAMGV